MTMTTRGGPASEEGWSRGLRAFRNYNFRLYFAGQLTSQIGTWIQNTAQAWLVVTLTHSPFKLGLVTALQALPMLFFATLGGVVADRVSKYRLLTITQAIMAILALILAVDVTARTVQIWHVYVLASLLGLTNAANMPTQQAFTVEMVGREDLMNAIALNSAQFNLSRIVGPALAGALIALVGLPLCFFLNALSFLAVIAALLLMRPSQFRLSGAQQRGGSVRSQLAEGVGYVRRTPLIFTILVLQFTLGTFAFNNQVIIPVFADKVLHLGPARYGIMSSFFGVGSLLAAVTVAFGSRPRWYLMLSGIGCFIFFSLTFAWSRFFPLSLLMLTGMGASMMSYNTQANTTVQTSVPDALRGRVMSLYMTLSIGSQPLGSFLTGTVASVLSPTVAVTTNMLVCGLVLAGLLGYGPSRRGIRSQPDLLQELSSKRTVSGTS